MILIGILCLLQGVWALLLRDRSYIPSSIVYLMAWMEGLEMDIMIALSPGWEGHFDELASLGGWNR